MDKNTCITNLRDLIKPSNTDDENEALLIAIQSVRARETVQGVVRTDKNGNLQIELLRPHGEWQEPFESNGKTYHKCSHCHISSELILFGNFCPNCGANMKGGAE